MPMNPGNSAFEAMPVVHDNFTSLGPGSIPVTDARELPFAPDSLPALDAGTTEGAKKAWESRSGGEPTTSKGSRSKANSGLATISRKYHNSIPVQEINHALTSAGLQPMEGGIFTGKEGRSHEQVGPNTWLSLQWHKMEATGRWEINAYVS
jgi:hypothetical protein